MELVWGLGSLAIFLGFAVVWLEAARFPDGVWVETGHNREVWLFCLVFVPIMWIPYLVGVRRRLLRSARCRVPS